MDAQKYIENRIDDQIEWYDGKSCDAQKKYKTYQTIEIISAAAIPVLSVLVSYFNWITFIIAVLGALITVVESITRLNKYHEHWLEYRSTCELLRYHKNLYLTKSYPYNYEDETIENIFVKNIENIISAENNQWKTINSIQEDSNKKD